MHRRFHAAGPSAVAATLLLACTACNPTTTLHMRATVDHLGPGLEITAFPFNPDRLLDSLAAAAPTARPRFDSLRTALSRFVLPDERSVDRASAPWRALRDTVAALSDSLQEMDPRAPNYEAMYNRFRGLYARLARETADRDRAVRELAGADRQLADRAQQAAESLRAWESEAYAPFPQLAEGEIARAGRTPQRAVTDSVGRATLVLEPGYWWLVARAADASNPFEEYYWNVAVVVPSWLSVWVPLDERSAVRRWRH